MNTTPTLQTPRNVFRHDDYACGWNEGYRLGRRWSGPNVLPRSNSAWDEGVRDGYAAGVDAREERVST